jgi:hypothetical protein
VLRFKFPETPPPHCPLPHRLNQFLQLPPQRSPCFFSSRVPPPPSFECVIFFRRGFLLRRLGQVPPQIFSLPLPVFSAYALLATSSAADVAMVVGIIVALSRVPASKGARAISRPSSPLP